MIPAWKLRCLYLAECVDAWRVAPRALLFASFWYVYHTSERLLSWYMALPAAERTLENGGFAAGIFTALTGFVTVIVNIYLKSGRNWDASGRGE